MRPFENNSDLRPEAGSKFGKAALPDHSCNRVLQIGLHPWIKINQGIAWDFDKLRKESAAFSNRIFGFPHLRSILSSMARMKFSICKSTSLLILILVMLSGNLCAQTQSKIREKDLARQGEPENLDVFHQWIRWNNGGSMQVNYLLDQAYALYAQRDREIAALTSLNDWKKRQQTVREKLKEILGPFPEKSALHPVITGVIKKAGYRIEKLVYQSRPGFYVTGLIYIPEGTRGRVPAVLNLIGHEQESFRAELDQVMALNLVKKGMVVLTIDPPGQGEHLQYFDRDIGFSSIGYSVVEHCYFGNQCFLSGASSAKYFIWDGIRAIDYLVSRRDVDPERIGVTGFSGGGTITSYLGALDDRVSVAVPSSWSTASRRQLETKGAQDAESTLVHSVAKGITFEDLIEVRAPKPTLMTFVSRDEYLTLQAAHEAYAEAANAYRAFDAGDHLKFVEDDSKHWLTLKIREAIYDFFMKHFGMPGSPSEEEVEIFSAAQLQITDTGQIATSLGGEMIFDVNKRESSFLINDLEKSRKEIGHHLQKVRATAQEISGYKNPGVTGRAFINGRYQRKGYTVTKIAIPGEGEYPIPILLFVPDGLEEKRPAIVYLHPQGKITDARPGGRIEELVRKGFIVAAADVLGVGETENKAATTLAVGYTAVLIGRSVVGIQAGDIVRAVHYLKTRNDIDSARIDAIGIREMCIPLIHAAAFDVSLRNIALLGSLVSYRSVAMSRLYRIGLIKRENGGTHHPYDIDFSWGVAKVLTGYDLPDLLGCIAPRKALLSGLLDHRMEAAPDSLIHREMEFPRAAYQYKNASSNIRISSDADHGGSDMEWVFR